MISDLYTLVTFTPGRGLTTRVLQVFGLVALRSSRITNVLLVLDLWEWKNDKSVRHICVSPASSLCVGKVFTTTCGLHHVHEHFLSRGSQSGLWPRYFLLVTCTGLPIFWGGVSTPKGSCVWVIRPPETSSGHLWSTLKPDRTDSWSGFSLLFLCLVNLKFQLLSCFLVRFSLNCL